MDPKVHRENERKLHELLHNNLQLLLEFYPATTDFIMIFRKDMFVKNNKTAFFETVYYLLNILDPDKTKQKLTAWPPYDIRRENKLRMEVLSYVNELNVLYDYADIPPIMQSHLISPGGYKFTIFILKLSELVVFEHLKKINKAELYCPSPDDRLEFHLNFTKKQTATINFNTRHQLDAFEEHHFDCQNKSQRIVEKLFEIDKALAREVKRNSKIKQDLEEKYALLPSLKDLQNKVHVLRSNWCSLKVFHNLFESCGSLLEHLKNGGVILEHDKEKLNVPSEIAHIIRSRDELDLVEFFQGLNVLLEHQALQLPNVTNSSTKELIGDIQSINFNDSLTLKFLIERKKEIEDAFEQILLLMKDLDITEETLQNTVLASN